MLPKISDYLDTAQDAIPRFAAELSGLPPTAAKEMADAVRAEVTEHVRVCPDKELLLAAFVVAEELYRAAATIEFWDASVADYLQCSAATFFGLLSQRGYQLHYVVDNLYEDPQRPTEFFPQWFHACGLAYICPLFAAFGLMNADGVAETDLAASVAYYLAEARNVASVALLLSRKRGRHYVYLETDLEEGCLDLALEGRGTPGVLSVFRNEAPVPGSRAAVVSPELGLG